MRLNGCVVWPVASLVFFAYVALAALRRGVTPGRRRRAWAGAAAGSTLALAAARLRPDAMANAVCLPAAALLIGYWTSGLLFVAPQPRVERALLAFDRWLRVDRVAAATPRILAELLELAYSGVYVFVLLALVLALRAHVTAQRFWTIVLVTDYVCFGMLACVQTRPPRTLTGDPAWHAAWRTINRRLLDASSVQVNTFPSGHAAEALVAALLATGASGPVVTSIFAVALMVSAGAVLGRYHYALDALTGWTVAVTVFYLLSSTFQILSSVFYLLSSISSTPAAGC
jgi:membrane-associated phospholipid phosphatase